MVKPRITDISVETAETLHTLLSTEQQYLVDHVNAVVSNGDRMLAKSLVGVTRALRLVGAEVVLTGIRPDMAKTLIEGGEILEGLVIQATVQGG